ncbi:MAG: hypothetical protein ACYC6L_14195, partial [Anaerolineae bacterium]
TLQSTSGGAVINAGPVDIGGWQLSDEDGNVYTIPEALPVVPRDAYVLVIFDGLGPGADDYDFSDGIAVLHSPPGLVDIFEDAADQVALYRSGTPSAATIVDFLAWGAPPAGDAANAYAVDLWDPSSYANFQVGFGAWEEDEMLPKNESLGRYPGGTGWGPQAYTLYQSGQLTPGAANPVPLPNFYTPEYGAVVETNSFSFSWSDSPGAAAYAVQLDDDVAFGNPLYSTTITTTYFMPPVPLAPGTYYWRVKAIGPELAEDGWAAPVEFGIVDFGLLAASAGIQQENVLGIAPVRQNKDTNLLCLDGDNEQEWDKPAPCTQPPCADNTKLIHGKGYCARASIRMMASYYGGSLSMDRISYYVKQEWAGNTRPGTNDNDPNNDLGHDAGFWPEESTAGISWALGNTIPMISGKPDFSVITATIDSGAPILFRRPGHMMVIDGYKEIGGLYYVHVLNSDRPPDFRYWQDYETLTIAAYWPGPVSAPDVRSDEPSVSTDSDGDGIMDFDEANRFATGVADADTDDDGRSDKIDIREYIFAPDGSWQRRKADYDEDGLRMEVDYDSDNGGSRDGCEDSNHNGIYEPALNETSNFNADDEKDCTVNHPPYVPVYLAPANGSVITQSNGVDLMWTGGDPDGDEVTYVVRTGISNQPDMMQCYTINFFCRVSGNDDTTYYWRVEAYDDRGGYTQGPVWTYSFDLNHLPYITLISPSDGSQGVGLGPTLTFTGGDPDGDAVTYLVWFGFNSMLNPPVRVCEWSANTSCSVGPLSSCMDYIWMVVARDEHGYTAQSRWWGFTTACN